MNSFNYSPSNPPPNGNNHINETSEIGLPMYVNQNSQSQPQPIKNFPNFIHNLTVPSPIVTPTVYSPQLLPPPPLCPITNTQPNWPPLPPDSMAIQNLVPSTPAADKSNDDNSEVTSSVVDSIQPSEELSKSDAVPVTVAQFGEAGIVDDVTSSLPNDNEKTILPDVHEDKMPSDSCPIFPDSVQPDSVNTTSDSAIHPDSAVLADSENTTSDAVSISKGEIAVECKSVDIIPTDPSEEKEVLTAPIVDTTQPAEPLLELKTLVTDDAKDNSINPDSASDASVEKVAPEPESKVEEKEEKVEFSNEVPLPENSSQEIKNALPQETGSSTTQEIKNETPEEMVPKVSPTKPKSVAQPKAKIPQKEKPKTKAAAKQTVVDNAADEEVVGPSKEARKRKVSNMEKEHPASPKDAAIDSKPKRSRMPTQMYQSPLPEIQLIEKLSKKEVSTTSATPSRARKTAANETDEKLIIFFKNEFLAVRNPESSFYICQTNQNIHRGSTRIKIRWFTQHPNYVYTPDFYDHTELDCILTNVTLKRLQKDRYQLSENERARAENILKRALDVEKGIVEKPSVTEEHPDGLDISLYKDEAQLTIKKKSAPKKKEDAEEIDETYTPEKKVAPKKSAGKKKKKAKGRPKVKKVSSASVPAPKKDTITRKETPASAKKEVASPAKKEVPASAKRVAPAATKKGAPTAGKKKAAPVPAKKEAPVAARKEVPIKVTVVPKKDVAASAAKGEISKKPTPSTSGTTAARPTIGKKTPRTTYLATTTTKQAASESKSTALRGVKGNQKVNAQAEKESQVGKKEEKATESVAAKRNAPAAASTSTVAPKKAKMDKPGIPGKVRNAGSAVQAKITAAAMRNVKDRNVANANGNQRKN